MDRRETTCLVCGRPYTGAVAVFRWFCSVGCYADAGAPFDRFPQHTTGRGRAARTPTRRKPDDE